MVNDFIEHWKASA